MTGKPTFVLSLGGSIVAPKGGMDTEFLKGFRELILRHVSRGWRFLIVVGGGATARAYQDAARKMGNLTRDDLDWLGIHATRMNGHLLRTLFRDVAHPAVIKDPTRAPTRWAKPVMIGAGWKPGWSTDYVAVRLAKRLGTDFIVNLSNIDYLYDKDPGKHKDAEPVMRIGWKEFRKMVGEEWDPGMNVPFDPVAAKLASASRMKVAIVNGTDLKNLDALLSGHRFTGTMVGG
ncbi:UMP kinase [Patescibacteria group bacterium]|nr:MAG: UMP kinase [Patescibacteria group bacterium]